MLTCEGKSHGAPPHKQKTTGSQWLLGAALFTHAEYLFHKNYILKLDWKIVVFYMAFSYILSLVNPLLLLFPALNLTLTETFLLPLFPPCLSYHIIPLSTLLCNSAKICTQRLLYPSTVTLHISFHSQQLGNALSLDCPSSDRWIMKMWCRYTVGFY